MSRKIDRRSLLRGVGTAATGLTLGGTLLATPAAASSYDREVYDLQTDSSTGNHRGDEYKLHHATSLVEGEIKAYDTQDYYENRIHVFSIAWCEWLENEDDHSSPPSAINNQYLSVHDSDVDMYTREGERWQALTVGEEDGHIDEHPALDAARDTIAGRYSPLTGLALTAGDVVAKLVNENTEDSIGRTIDWASNLPGSWDHVAGIYYTYAVELEPHEVTTHTLSDEVIGFGETITENEHEVIAGAPGEDPEEYDPDDSDDDCPPNLPPC